MAPPQHPEPPPPAPVGDAAAHWAAVRALFDTLISLPPAARAEALAAADEAVRREVGSLLDHAEGAATGSGFLAAPAAAQAATDGTAAPERRGLRLGAWQVDERLGHGGMGEVWRAHRADGSYEGAAAVKILKRGLDTASVLERFAREQRALARLNHPHIARLFDAGLTPDGLPYFVMELVEGRPLDEAAAPLPLRRQIELVLQLADAVAHAHRHLLVHRDLKPGNVLVDAEGQVKLLDFGIAKALDPQDTTAAELTQLGARAYTPGYASPEQVRGDAVGTATDVYSLGVLLYGLLTGSRPYARGAASAAEAARAVLEEEPLRPSLAAAAALPGAERAARARALRGDLDNILLKALRKAPEERYASVDALAADLRAHLDGRPVAARAPTPLYVAARFVRRNRLASAAAALAVVALVGGAALALWQARVAEAERAVAQQRFAQVRQLANQLVFKYHDKIEYLPGASPVREAMLTDAAAFLDNLRQAAAGDPGLAEELAGTYYRIARLQGLDPSVNVGRHEDAEANLDKALALAQTYAMRPGLSTSSLGAAVNMHISDAERWQRRGRLLRADASIRAGLALLEPALARAPRDTWALASAISLHGVHARILGNQPDHAHLGRWEAACDSAARARAAAEATLAADPANIYVPDSLAFTLGEQAHCLALSGRVDEAAALAERQIELRDEMTRKMPDDLDFRYQCSVARAQLARLRSAQGRHADAQALLGEARRQGAAALAADPSNAGGAERLDAMDLAEVELHLAAGDETAAQRSVAALLARWRSRAQQAAAAGAASAPAGPAGAASGTVTATGPAPFAERRRWAEALLLSARAWRGADAAQALADAQAAAALMQGDDDNHARAWLRALALGERALALAAQGHDDQAADAARAALAAWPGGEARVPPALRERVAPVARLAQRALVGTGASVTGWK